MAAIRLAIPMTLAELIAAFRTEADDATTPYLWSDGEVAGYFADAENEACIRAGLLSDETTPLITQIPITMGSAWLSLSPLVLNVERAWLEGTGDLQRVSLEQLERYHLWVSQGTPKEYAISGNRLRLYPTPSEAATLALRVSRLPLSPLVSSALQAEPEIPPAEHLRLLDWTLYRAFSRRDADTFDARRALDYRGRFDGYFGPRPSAHARRQYREARKHCVMFNPF